MGFPLQKTKLFLPTTRTRLVARPRLLERLDTLLTGDVQTALISAPPGCGKTTLVVQWLGRIGIPTGWLSLEGRDNLPGRFLSYLIAALQKINPQVGSEAFGLTHMPGVNLDEVVTLLLNDLADAGGLFPLVLDDFHTITNPALLQIMDTLLDAPQLRCLFLTRQDPALQLARRRANGKLLELRQEDLLFNLPEALEFLNQVMGLSLSIRQVELLEARTEGWIAGLQLAAVSLQRAADAERFIQEFSGSHRYILDYLVEEVLLSQPVEVQQFLLATAILERMNAGLCAAVTGMATARARALLERLTRSNLFIVSLDEERHWFRYHHLFAELLHARLLALDSNNMDLLYQRASSWFEANGDPRAAVEYALKGHAAQLAANFFERHIAERWQTVDLEFFLLVNQLPVEVLADRPALCLQSAWIYLATGQADRILPMVEIAEGCLNSPDRPNTPTDVADRAFARILRAYLADFQNQPVSLDETLDQAFASIPEAQTGLRNSVAVVIGTLYFMEGEFTRAADYFEDALKRDKRVNGTNAVPIAVMRLVWVLKARGRLHEALELLKEHARYVAERGSRRFYIAGVLNLLWGEILIEWNRLPEAESQILEGLKLMESWPIPPVKAVGLSLLSRLQSANGNHAAAQAALEKAEDVLQGRPAHAYFTNYLEEARVWCWVGGQNQAALQSWISEQAGLAEAGQRFRYEQAQVNLCRAWLATGRTDEALALLEKLAAAAPDRPGSQVVILALLAVARSSEPEAALQALDEAIRIGEPEGYMRVFLEIGETLEHLLRSWLHRRPESSARLRAYATRILAAIEVKTAAHAAPPAAPGGPVEPLSRREREVLRLVAGGLTNQQIASRLVISTRTVKKHIENIHGKLGVQNRMQAAARARELGMIDESS